MATALRTNGRLGSIGLASNDITDDGDQIPCMPLSPGLSAGASDDVERCFAWGDGLGARPEKSLAPLLDGSHGFGFTEFDTAIAADARELCGKEQKRRDQAKQAKAEAKQQAKAEGKQGANAAELSACAGIQDLHRRRACVEKLEGGRAVNGCSRDADCQKQAALDNQPAAPRARLSAQDQTAIEHAGF